MVAIGVDGTKKSLVRSSFATFDQPEHNYRDTEYQPNENPNIATTRKHAQVYLMLGCVLV